MITTRVIRTAPSSDPAGGPHKPQQNQGSGIGLPYTPPSLPTLGHVPRVDVELLDHLSLVFQPTVSDSYTLDDYRRQEGVHQVISYLKKLWRDQQTDNK